MTRSRKPMFQQLMDQYPETDNYLEQVGQVNNVLLTMREIDSHENHIPDWLERLAITKGDLKSAPTSIHLLKVLQESGITVQSRMTVQDFREYQREYEQDQLDTDRETPLPEDSLETLGTYNVLDNHQFDELCSAGEREMLDLPELVEKLTTWATQTMRRYTPDLAPLTVKQSYIVANLVSYLRQDLGATADLWEASLRSLPSLKFFKKAANPQQ